jgi:hypothetical protein
MNQTRLSLAVLALAVAVALHAFVPRYDVVVRDTGVFRWDRWTGQLEAAQVLTDVPWVTLAPHR